MVESANHESSQDSALADAAPSTSNAAPQTSEEPSARGVHHTRMSSWWIGLIITAVILVLLLVFIGQNSRGVTIHYLGLKGRVSLAIALLLSAVAGLLLVAVPGTARILQLRRSGKAPRSRRK